MPNTKAKTPEAKTPKAKAPENKPTPRAAAIEAHTKAGFAGTVYRGVSKTRNSAIAHVIDTTTSKATARDYAALTERMHATLRELGTAYGNGTFNARGIDRGQAAIFISSKIMLPVAGTGEQSNGIYSDGATPLKLRLSAEAQKRYAK